MKKSMVSLFILFLMMAVSISGGAVAFGQDDGDDSDVFTLEEVTVTAAKSGEQNLQKVPIAIDVITGDDFAEGAKSNVDDILEGLAGVFINTSSDGMRVSIRGVTDTDPVFSGKKSSTPTVAMNVDGAYNSMNNAGQNLFDVERIEVLMGPQSTLYASNSPGGVVNIITASPKTDKYSANVSVEYGSYERSVLQAALNAPIVRDKVAARLSLNRTRENSFMEPYTDELSTKNEAARLKVLWAATDDLELTLTGNYSVNGNQGEMSQQAAPFDKASGSSDWTAAENAQGANNPIDQKNTGVNLNISWDSPVGNLSIEPSYYKSDSSGNQSGMVGIGPPGPDQQQVAGSWYSERIIEQESTEARLSSPDDLELLKYVVGFFYYTSDMQTATLYDGDLADQNREEGTDSEQTAVYGNITYPLPFNEKLSITAGFRNSWDYAHQTGSSPGGDDDTEMDVSNPDYKFGFQYDMDDQTMFYGSYTSSFRLDGMAMYNWTGVRPPEELKSYTVGAKTRFFNNRVQVNAAAYYYDYANRFFANQMSRTSVSQEELETLVFPEGSVYYDGNTGTMVDYSGQTYWSTIDTSRGPDMNGNWEVFDKGFLGWGDSRTIGADVSVSWVVTNKDLVDFTLSYIDVEWTDLTYDYKYSLLEDIPDDQTYDGATAPNSPKFSMTAAYEHKFDIGHFGTLKPHVDVMHKTGFDLVFDQSDGMGYGKQESYFLYNASLGFISASQKWSVNAIVKNIGNYAVKRSYDSEGQRLMLGDPRTYSVTATMKF
jgi:iron complex outermembrane receptor protein